MILTAHLLTGAALASKIQPTPFALLLALASHYFLDFLPHRDYDIENLKAKNWSRTGPALLRISLDLSFGLLVVLVLAKNPFLALAGGFFALLPDGVVLLNIIFPNSFFNFLGRIHRKIHFFKHKNIPLLWGILSYLAIFLLSALLLFY
jgi:hypothetical protein